MQFEKLTLQQSSNVRTHALEALVLAGKGLNAFLVLL
jgi:hypothetical protein